MNRAKIKDMSIVEKRALLSAVRDIGEAIWAVPLMLVPRHIYELRLTKLLLKHYPSQFGKIVFFKSGRSALTAFFEKLAVQEKKSIVLLPDYICNVVYMSASKACFSIKVYQTDDLFRPDMKGIKALLRTEPVCAVLFASIFGTQNNTSEILSSIRSASPDVFIIFDECQNIITGSPLVMDSKTVCVMSFNDKTVPGLMGGALCLPPNTVLDIERPKQNVAAGLLYELIIWGLLAKKVLRRISEVLPTLVGRLPRYAYPRLEFSLGTRRLYDLEPRPAAKLSLIYAVRGLYRLSTLERIRKHNYALFREFMADKGYGILLATERAEIAPYVPFRLKDHNIFNQLPIKGPYAMMEDSSKTLRKDTYSIKNNREFTLHV